MYDNALDEWKSLCTDEVENIWNKERKELRRAAMIFFVLRQEFNMIEYELNCEMTKFKQKFKLIDDFKEVEKSKNCELLDEKPPQPQATDVVVIECDEKHPKEVPLHRSPKINKNRKMFRPKRPSNSPSLLDTIQKEKNQMTILVTPNPRVKRDLIVCAAGDASMQARVLQPANNPRSETNTPQNRKPYDNENVIDSSIVEDGPDISVTKKIKLNKPANLPFGKATAAKQKPKNILRQILISIPTQQSMKHIPIRQCPKTSKIVQHGEDETFFEPNEASKSKRVTPESNKSVQSKAKKLKLVNFKHYDKVPVAKDTGPQHAHKTETVRRKADRLKLPGWSCMDCQQYYESLNLPVEELQQKMNACSKHRNKFKPLDETPKGYWDITMASTQENSWNDSTIYI